MCGAVARKRASSPATHTPGPWQAKETPASSNQDWVVTTAYGERTHRLASVYPTGDDAADEANARLIAAAPDMLAALKELMPALLADHGASGGLNEASRKRASEIVSAALSKAKGAA